MASIGKKSAKRKTTKSGNTDVNANEAMSDSQSQVTDASSDGEKPLLKRDSFICSTGHNAHLREDYETDETLLVGRKVIHHRRDLSEISSVDSRSLRSLSIDATLSHASSLDFPTPSLTGTLERKHLQTVPEEGDARSQAYSVSLLDFDQGHKRKDSGSISQLGTPKETKRKFGVLGRFRSADEQSYSSKDDLRSSRASSEVWDAESLARSVYSTGPRSAPILDAYEPYTTAEDEFFGRRKLKKQQSTTSLHSTRNAEGRLLVARASVVHPVGPFNEPAEVHDESASYAAVFDPTLGLARLIRRDSVIHPPPNPADSFPEDMALDRRNSVVRPLKLEPSGDAGGKVYKRNSLTHVYPDALGEDMTELMAALMQSNGTAMTDKLRSDREPIQRLPRPLWINERFENPWRTWQKVGLLGNLKWRLSSSDRSSIPRIEKLNRTLPMVVPKFDAPPPEHGIRVTWLGHSTVLVQMEGIAILTDPMFSERASPVQFMGTKRYREPPCTIDELPNVDAVVISHNHYDHLDFNSVEKLNTRFGHRLRWFVPLGLQTWMESIGCEDVFEMSWWEEGSLPSARHITVKFTPTQHWCSRSPTDDNKVLWGSWCIIGEKQRFFFAGDTGYCDVFKIIGRECGPFDLAAIPIGCYEPRWFMKSQYIDPDEAVLIHEDLRSRQSIGIHWGTFCLSHEHYLDPPKRLQIALSRRALPPHTFFTLRHGETKLVAGV